MNVSKLKAALLKPQNNLLHINPALFHSTPVLERKRRNHWNSYRSHQPSNPYHKRFRKLQSKRAFLRDVSAYADHLFQSWRDEIGEDDPSSSKGTSWFNKQYERPERGQNKKHHYQYSRKFHFCEDEDEIDFDVDRMFKGAFGLGSSFGRNQHFYWSFMDEEDTKWKYSSRFGNNYWNNGNWRFRTEEEDSSESESSNVDMSMDRRALGLSAYGPLKLEDVKIAYRACALKWHPDRHQGSSKAVAEEKFKVCSQAYQSLCDKLALN